MRNRIESIVAICKNGNSTEPQRTQLILANRDGL